MQNLRTLARTIAGEADALARSRRLLDWLHGELFWSASDYQQRTVEEILARKAGNCAEQARVLRALLKALDIPVRTIAEINLEPPNTSRQETAASFVAADGPSASVFGLRHNDHRWLEVFVHETGSWEPLDVTLGICGTEQWVLERLGFDRPEKKGIDAYRDMIIPLCVFVVDEQKRPVEDRTRHYLAEQFNRVHGGELAGKQHWQTWVVQTAAFSALAWNAFWGKENLHAHDELFVELGALYESLHP